MAIHANLILDESPHSAELISWIHFFWPHIPGNQISIELVDGIMQHPLDSIFDSELLENHAYSYVELCSKVVHRGEFCQEFLFNQAIQLVSSKGYKTQVYSEPNAIQHWIENSKFHDLSIFSRAQLEKSDWKIKEHLLDYFVRSSPPILLLPVQPKPFSKLIFTFDGSLHATQTIKKFIQLFAFLFPATPLIFNTIIQPESLPQEKPIIEYIKSYCPNFSLIRTYLSEQWDEILPLVFDGERNLWVSCFARNTMSEFLRNLPQKAIENTQTAIFFD